jgi:hypothetical protein
VLLWNLKMHIVSLGLLAGEAMKEVSPWRE